MATIEHEHITEVFTTFGDKRVSAEQVAGGLCRQVSEYLDGGVPVGPFLADQLLLPLAILAITVGSFSIGKLTSHSLTNLETIHRFLSDRLLRREGRASSMIEIREIERPNRPAIRGRPPTARAPPYLSGGRSRCRLMSAAINIRSS